MFGQHWNKFKILQHPHNNKEYIKCSNLSLSLDMLRLALNDLEDAQRHVETDVQ